MNGAVQPNGQGLFEFGKNAHEQEYPKDIPTKEDKTFTESALTAKLHALHGKPSKGARIDAEIEAGEEKELEVKEERKEQSERSHGGRK